MKRSHTKQTSETIIVLLTLMICMTCPTIYGQNARRHGPGKPTNTELLLEFNFEATPEGLALALDSAKPFARIYALKVISENKDASHLTQVKEQLEHKFIKVQLEAAKVLSQFERPEGITWLRQWDERFKADSKVSADTAHVVLDAATALAQRGDERLGKHINPLLRHQSWAVRMHAARTLGDFKDLDSQDLETAWITSAKVAMEALQGGKQEEEQFVELYLSWLSSSAGRQTVRTQSIEMIFGELASHKHTVGTAQRQRLIEQWNAKPILNE